MVVVDGDGDGDGAMVVMVVICICDFNSPLGKGSKKNWEKAVMLTAWVDPPLPSPEAVRKKWKFLNKLPYLGLFCRFIKDKNG